MATRARRAAGRAPRRPRPDRGHRRSTPTPAADRRRPARSTPTDPRADRGHRVLPAGGHPPARPAESPTSTTPGAPTSTSGAGREHMRSIVRRLYDPMYRYWFRVEWEGLEKIPTEGGALLIANHAGAIPSDAPAIMHGIETELGPARLRAGRLLLPDRPGGRAPCGRAPAACPPTPTTPTGSSTTSSSWPWSSPRAPRPPPRRTPTATGCAGSAGAASWRSPCGPACPVDPHRRGRRRGGDAHPVPAAPGGQGPQPALLPGHRQLAPARARSATSPTSRPSSSCGSSTRSPSTWSPGQERYSRSRVMDEAERIRATMQDALHDMLRERRSVWFG